MVFWRRRETDFVSQLPMLSKYLASSYSCGYSVHNRNTETGPPSMELVCSTIEEKTGWSAMIYIGGPDLANGSKITSQM